MKNTRNVLFFIFSMVIVVACDNNNDHDFFCGEIKSVIDTVQIMQLPSNKIVLQGAYDGHPTAYDSLIFFCNWHLPDAYYSVFSLNSGKHLGNFFPKSDGYMQTLGVSGIFQFYKENDQLKTLLLAANDAELLIWNISKSLEQNKTICDSIIPYDWKTEHITAVYSNISYLNDRELLAYVPSTITSMDGRTATLPYWQKRTLYTNELIKNYTVFKKSVQNSLAGRLFNSQGCLKPDKSKIAQGMRYFAQINIIDIGSDNIVGYRIAGTPSFSTFNKDREDIPVYYTGLQVNDQYIFALYNHMESIHVFNWDGILIRKLKLEDTEGALDMFLDQKNNFLYTINRFTKCIYCYNLNDNTL
jgi:hypothetical protein